MDDLADGAFQDAGGRDVRPDGEHARPFAAEAFLERLPKLGGQAVHLDLGVPVMGDPVHFPATPSPLEVEEDAVEISIVILREIDTVGIVPEVVPIVGKRVLLHLETLLHRIDDGIDIHLFLPRLGEFPLHRGETERVAEDDNPLGRPEDPPDSHQDENTQDERQYLTRLHRL